MTSDQFKAVLVDDEIGALNNLKNLIRDHLPQIEIVGASQTVPEAVEVVRLKRPDFVFLDIQIGARLGFEVLDQTADLSYQVVFTTAYSQYAINAIRYAAADYLLKPIGPDDLIGCMNRINSRNHNSPGIGEINSILKSEKRESIIIPDTNSYHITKVADIVRCESDSSYTTFFLIDGSSITASNPMKYFESMLPESDFFRIHKSHLVRKEYIQKVGKGESGFVEMEGGKQVPISRRRKQMFMQWLRGV